MSTTTHTLQCVITAMPHAVLLITVQGRVCLANQAAADLLGYDSQDLIGLLVENFMPKQYSDSHRALHDALNSQSGITHMVPQQSLLGWRADGTETQVDISLSKVFWADGEPLRMATLMDRYEHNSLLSALKESERRCQDAVEANLAKSRFLSTMSHEIRTPMNGILGMAQLLLMPELQESERRDYARTILSSGQALLTLLNDILDLSKIEAGKLQINPTVFEPESLLRETHNLFMGAALAKNLRLTFQWHTEGAPRYRADSHRLRQMLANLAGNALKFTQQGQICLEGRELIQDPDGVVLEFSVSDTGLGIAPDKLPLLFTPFTQAEASTHRDYGGSGLGLSIVHSLAEAMGGKVGVESQPGKGSRFWFQLRAQAVSDLDDARQTTRPDLVTPESTIRSSVSSARLLVVEDNLVNRMVIESLLSKLGVQVTLVTDGQQAVHVITQHDQPDQPDQGSQSQRFDLILMDLQLPVLDGYAATAQIRQWETQQQQARLPIIALTADAFEENRDQCLAAGMDDFLTKPISLPALQTTLERWLTRQTMRRNTASECSTK
ncbi:MAG: response regulator [Comamonadaceae bacterium]|nr:response regulator [Comamonadaceae bacterium]